LTDTYLTERLIANNRLGPKSPRRRIFGGGKNDLERRYPFRGYKCAREAAYRGQGKPDSVSSSPSD
jgi:hypothetical protein